MFLTEEPRQFAPEYSQRAYESLLQQEIPVGNYFEGEGSRVLEISSVDRKLMIVWMEEIIKLKQFCDETLYSAVAIADNYLAKLVPQDEVAPCMIQLGLTCLWIATKLEEHRTADLDCLITYVTKNLKVQIKKRDVQD